MTYSLDGIRMPVEDFVHLAGFILKDPLGLLDQLARQSVEPVGYLRSGARGGKPFEIITDANRKVISEWSGKYHPALEVDFESETPIYPDVDFDPTLIPQDPPKVKNATPEQQTRFNEAYNEFWKRLHANDGKNACADLFGGLKKAEDALKSSTYSFTPTKSGSPAETDGKRIDIHPTGHFMSKNDAAKFDVGSNLPARQVYYVVLSNVEAAAFILAHEIGHRTRTLEPDAHDQSSYVSVLNNGKVRDACFSDIPTATRLF